MTSVFEQVKAFLKEKFPHITPDGIELSSNQASVICQKIILDTNILRSIGIPLKITSSCITGAKMTINDLKSIQVMIDSCSITTSTEQVEETQPSKDNRVAINLEIKDLNIAVMDEDSPVPILNIKSKDIRIDLDKNHEGSIKFGNTDVLLCDKLIISQNQCDIIVSEKVSLELHDLDVDLSQSQVSAFYKLFYQLKQSQCKKFSCKADSMKLLISSSTILDYRNIYFEIGNGDFLVQSPELFINFSSYQFTVRDMKFSNTEIYVSSIRTNNEEVNHIKLSQNSPEEPIVISQITKKNELQILVKPMTINVELNYLIDLINFLHNNFFIQFFKTSTRKYGFLLDFSSINLIVNLDNDKSINFSFVLNITQLDKVKQYNISDLSICFTDSLPIISNLLLQLVLYSKNDEETATFFMSPQDFKLSIHEVKDFFGFFKKMYHCISLKTIPSLVKIDINTPQINLYIGETIYNTKVHQMLLLIQIEPLLATMICMNESLSYNLSPQIIVKYYNPITSHWDVIVDSFSPVITGYVSPMKLHISLMVEKQHRVLINIPANFILRLNKAFETPVVHSEPEVFVENETEEIIYISPDEKSPEMPIHPGDHIPFFSNTLYLHHDEQIIKLSPNLITYTMFVYSDLIVSPTATGRTAKLLRFCPIMAIENQLDENITFFVKEKKVVKEIMIIPPQKRVELPFQYHKADACLFSLSSATNVPTNTFSLKKEKQRINYQLNGTYESECMINIATAPDTLTKIVALRSKIDVTSHLPIPITINIIGINFKITKLINQNSSAPLLLNSDMLSHFSIYLSINDFITDDLSLSSKTLNKPQCGMFDFTKQKDGIKLQISFYAEMNTVNEVIHLHLYTPLIVSNMSNSPIMVSTGIGDHIQLISNKPSQVNLPIYLSDEENNPKLLIGNEHNPTINVPTTTKPKQLTLQSSQLVLLQLTAKPVEYFPFIVKTEVLNNYTKQVTIKDAFIVNNLLDKKVVFWISKSTSMSFEPGFAYPLNLVNKKIKFSMTIDGFETISEIYMYYLINTVIRFVGEEEQIFVKFTINIEEGQRTITISRATLSTASFILVNQMSDHLLFAQQEESLMPITVTPMTSTIFGFDFPYAKPDVVLTIEGISQVISFSQEMDSLSLPFRISNTAYTVTVKALENGSRAIIVGLPEKQKELVDRELDIQLCHVEVSLIRGFSQQLICCFLKTVSFSLKNAGLYNKMSFSIHSLQIDDQQSSNLLPGVFFCGISDANVPWLQIVACCSPETKFPASISSLSILLQKTQIQVNGMVLSYLFQFLKESKLSFSAIHKILFNDRNIYLSNLKIYPVIVALLITKESNVTPNLLKKIHPSLHSITPPLFALLHLPLIDMYQAFGSVTSLNHLLLRLYKLAIQKFYNQIVGDSIEPESLTYPAFLFQKMILHLDEPPSFVLNQISNEPAEFIERKDTFPINRNQIKEISRVIWQKEFFMLKDEDFREAVAKNVNFTWKTMKKSTTPRSFFLNKIESQSIKTVGAIISSLKKLRNTTSLFLLLLIDNDSKYAGVTNDSIATIDMQTSNIIRSVPFDSILTFDLKNSQVMISISPEKPKQQPIRMEMQFRTDMNAEVFVNLVVSLRNKSKLKI